MARKRKPQREHKPHEHGPRTYREGRYYRADLRPWGGGRPSLRNPRDPRWPKRGERTEDADTARQWSWAYVEYFRDGARSRAQGRPVRPRVLQDACEEYEKHRKQTVEPNTRGTDKTALGHLTQRFGKRARTDDITTDKLQAWVDDMLRAGYAVTTMESYLTSLSAFFRWLGGFNPVRWDNPATGKSGGVVLPERQQAEAHAWSDEQLEKIRDAADWVVENASEKLWPDARLMVEFFLATGCRQQEGFAARWPRINREHKTIRIVEQLDRDTLETRQLKGKLARTALILPDWWAHDQPEAEGLILGRTDGKPIGKRMQANLLERVLSAARLSIPGVGYHAFRHTYSRIFIEQGGRLQELQKSLGHSSIVVTEQRYGHFEEDVAARLARMRIYKEATPRLM